MFRKINIFFILIFSLTANASKLQVGDGLERLNVSLKKFNSYDFLEKKVILATVKILNESTKSLGTGFAFKTIDNQIAFLTNNHVMSNQRECDKAKITYITDELKVRTVGCAKVIKTGSKAESLDFTLFTLRSSDTINEIFAKRLLDISAFAPMPGEQVITAGFGYKSFDERRFDIAMASDKDCKVLAGPIDLEMQDYNMINSFSVGCDAKSGDSGSVVVSKNSGKIIGILFGLAELKRKQKPLSSKEIEDHLNDDYYERFWTASTWATSIDIILNNL